MFNSSFGASNLMALKIIQIGTIGTEYVYVIFLRLDTISFSILLIFLSLYSILFALAPNFFQSFQTFSVDQKRVLLFRYNLT
jgi:hypothetical protein